MAYGPRKKDELLDEYFHLERTVPHRLRLSHLAGASIQARIRALAGASDLTWMPKTTGTLHDLWRVKNAVDALGESPMTKKFGVLLLAYEQQLHKPAWQHPARDQWVTLIQEAHRVISTVYRARKKQLREEWYAWKRPHDQLVAKQKRLRHLEEILGREIWEARQTDRVS